MQTLQVDSIVYMNTQELPYIQNNRIDKANITAY